MCVWCAYIGKKNVAKRLWQAGKEIEGLWSGCYTGLVTLQDKKFYFDKCMGWSKCWEEKFNIDDYPGAIGMFHSRTDSGGNESWAHPFVADEVALVGQGSLGIYENEKSKYIEVAERLLKQGVKFSSADYLTNDNKYMGLSDGSQVHLSDIVCRYAEDEYRKTGNPFESIRKVATDLPEESVSIFMFKSYPDRIFGCNVNQMACWCHEKDGVLLATSPLAAPQNRWREIPGNTVFEVTSNGVRWEKLADKYDFDFIIADDVWANSMNLLHQKKEATLEDICKNAVELNLRGSGQNFGAVIAHRLIYALVKAGIVKLPNVEYISSCGHPAIETRISLI